MKDHLILSVVLPVKAESLYDAWLDSREHSAFTGSPAEIDPTAGGNYTAWDGYISGRTIELEPYRRIVQSWRTTGFPEDATDSRLELIFEPVAEGTRLTLIHSEIPENQGEEYEQGWESYYFQPMQAYFQSQKE